MKEVVSRDRPKLEDPVATAWGKSFPSGHAFTSTAMYGALLLVFLPAIPKRFRPWAFAAYATLVAAIAFSRLALGVHFVSDVVGGIVLGAAWLVARDGGVQHLADGARPEAGEPKRGLEPEAAKDLKPAPSVTPACQRAPEREPAGSRGGALKNSRGTLAARCFRPMVGRVTAGETPRDGSRVSGSNRRPAVYKTAALPLS